jgi:ATP-dependent Clp protease ATP-binding subunit ClpC
MPVNSIVVAACLEWMERHLSAAPAAESETPMPVQMFRPRWSTLRRAVQLAGPAAPGRAYPFDGFTAAAQGMLTAAQEEAKAAGLSYIGTEHLLLASFRNGTSDSARVLATLGVSEQSVRSMLEKMLKAKKVSHGSVMVPTSRVKKVIELAFNLCGSMGAHRVTTGHILGALAREGDGIAARVLGELGVKPNAIESTLAAVTESEA